MTAEESQHAHNDALTKERIGEEIADVLLYLLQLADHSQIDLKRAVGRKLAMNAKKYPPVRTSVPIERKTKPQTHVLVDWENVQPKDVDTRKVVPDVTDVWLFHGPHQKRVEVHHASFGDRVTLVPIARTGRNALDFHLSFYMGYIASRHSEAKLVVMANDRGYGPMIEHAMDLGFAAHQVGFVTVLPANSFHQRQSRRRRWPKGSCKPLLKLRLAFKRPQVVRARKHRLSRRSRHSWVGRQMSRGYLRYCPAFSRAAKWPSKRQGE